MSDANRISRFSVWLRAQGLANLVTTDEPCALFSRIAQLQKTGGTETDCVTLSAAHAEWRSERLRGAS